MNSLHMSVTHMQLRAARSRCTNFFWAKYSIPFVTCSPKPIRSFTVGFWTNHTNKDTGLKQLQMYCTSIIWLTSTVLMPLLYPLLAAYEVSQVPVLHVRQHHQREPFLWQEDAQQRQHIAVVETLHYDAFLQKLLHLLHICYSWRHTLTHLNILDAHPKEEGHWNHNCGKLLL